LGRAAAVSKFWVILQREYAQIVRKRSFVIGIISTPIIMGAMLVLPALLMSKQSGATEYLGVMDMGRQNLGEQFATAVAEYKLPDSSASAYEVRRVIALESSDSTEYRRVYDSLTLAIAEGDIKYFLVIRPGAQESDSNLTLVANSDDWLAVSKFESVLSRLLSTYRLQSSGVNLPIDSVLTLTRGVNLPTTNTKGESIPFMYKYFAALLFVMLIYMMIIVYGTMLMRSVIEEKSSRIVEVLVSSVTAFQLMLGKVLGMGLAAFTQVAAWVVLGLALYVATGSAGVEIDPAAAKMAFNPVIVIFFMLYFIAGYIMYSTLFAFVGAIVNTDKESQSFIFPIIFMLIIPLVVGGAVARDPYATWAVVLSYIPLCTPTMMLERVVYIAPTATKYSLFSGIVGEATLGLIAVIITTIGFVWVTGKVFRIGILMYGKRPTLPEIIKWIRY
jgi:ABC-2 type transport system permease protein